MHVTHGDCAESAGGSPADRSGVCHGSGESVGETADEATPPDLGTRRPSFGNRLDLHTADLEQWRGTDVIR
jgi:hypothetical protein